MKQSKVNPLDKRKQYIREFGIHNAEFGICNAFSITNNNAIIFFVLLIRKFAENPI